MAQSILNLEVTNDHAIPIQPSSGVATISVLSGDTLYYADNAQVSATNNQGSLIAGGSQVFGSTVYIRSASLSTVQVSKVLTATTGALIVPVASMKLIPDTSVIAAGINAVRMCRVMMPITGMLHDVSVYVGTSSGNLIVGVYDTGDMSPGNRTLLWSSGSVPCGAGGAWQIVGDPALPVVQGQQVELALIPDNGTATFGRYGAPISNNAATLPPGFYPAVGGAQAKLASTVGTGGFALPASIAEASLTGLQSIYALIARIL